MGVARLESALAVKLLLKNVLSKKDELASMAEAIAESIRRELVSDLQRRFEARSREAVNGIEVMSCGRG